MQPLEWVSRIEFDCGGMLPLDWEYHRSWKFFLEKRLLDWINETKNGIEILEIEITKYFFVISGLEYKDTLVFFFQSLTLCKNSLEFCLGLLWLIFPTSCWNENVFYLYDSPKMNLPTFWTSWKCFMVLEIG